MEITGQYERTIYRNEDTGYTCFLFNTRDIRPSKVKCVGVCPTYSADMPLKLSGELKSDDTFAFTDCSPCVNSKEKMVNFLSGSDFQGVGEKTAEKIYDFVGGDIFSFVLKMDAEEELSKEFGKKVAKSIVSKIRSLTGASRIFKCIENYGGNMTHAVRISTMADYDEFIEDIYRFGKKAGLSFGCCDSIAKANNWSPYDKKRMYALLDEAMDAIFGLGHSYTDIRGVTKMINSICKSSAYSEQIPSPYILSHASRHPKYKVLAEETDVKYYSSFLYKAENSASENILRLSHSAIELPFREEIIEEIERECGIQYSESQKASFNMLKTTGIKILTGGPGTGKSTVIKGIIQAIKKMFPNESPLLCAPTGRAAQRLKEVTGEDSFTIHKALNLLPYENGTHNYDQIESRFIIIDEASMIDISILDILLCAINSSSFVLFCGDINQLPSVGPGNVLHDMIHSGKIETTTLDVVFRQLEDSLINFHAHQIMEGRTKVKEGKDFHFHRCSSEEEMVEKIKEIAKEKYDREDIFSFQILAPAKEGFVGVRSLNKLLQPICNDYESEDSSSVYRFKKFDKIIMTRNNYSDGYLNGDIGIITDVTETSLIISLGDGKEISVSKDNPEDVSPAYALTVHKSQGSEFSSVVIVLSEEPRCMLQRNLLYTAITRAKKEVFLVVQNDSYKNAIRNTRLAQRKTSLKEKIEREGTHLCLK